MKFNPISILDKMFPPKSSVNKNKPNTFTTIDDVYVIWSSKCTCTFLLLIVGNSSSSDL